jgi:hypothetical protein
VRKQRKCEQKIHGKCDVVVRNKTPVSSSQAQSDQKARQISVQQQRLSL